jgi:uncharacterized damage-inducible protein DinB
MKRREVFGLALAAPAALRAAPAGSLARQMLPRWETSKKYTLAFLEKMPAEHWSFKPVPEINSFAQQAQHIADGNFLLAGAIAGEKPPKPAPPASTSVAMRAYVTLSYDYAAKVLGGLSDEATGQSVDFFQEKLTRGTLAFRLLDHAAHHRGQLVIYLRLKGIVPPEYPG